MTGALMKLRRTCEIKKKLLTEFVPIIIRPFDDQLDDKIEEDFNEDEENCEE